MHCTRYSNRHQQRRKHRERRRARRLWQQRRRQRLISLWPWWTVHPQDVDTHAPSHLFGKKRKEDRRYEERRFRQKTRRALAHGEPMPRYRHDWAD